MFGHSDSVSWCYQLVARTSHCRAGHLGLFITLHIKDCNLLLELFKQLK